MAKIDLQAFLDSTLKAEVESLKAELAAARKQSAERLAMLKHLEWSGWCEDGLACPICEAWEFRGHAEECALDKMIKEGENTDGS